MVRFCIGRTVVRPYSGGFAHALLSFDVLTAARVSTMPPLPVCLNGLTIDEAIC